MDTDGLQLQHKENLIGSARVQPMNVNVAFTFANLREAEGPGAKRK